MNNNNNKKSIIQSKSRILNYSRKKILKKDETKGFDILQNKLYIKGYITQK